MGWKDMLIAPVTTGFQQTVAWESFQELNYPGNGDWILIPDNVMNVATTLSFTGGGSGKIQTTSDLIDTIKTGSPIAVDWPFGTVSITTQKACYPPSAIRVVQENAGTIKMTLRAN